MRKLGVSPKAKDIVAELPPVNNWLETTGELLQKYQSGPAFSAYLTSNSSIPSGAYTKLTTMTEVFDRGGYFDNTTGRFTAPFSGIYHFTSRVYMDMAGVSAAQSAIYKNGSLYQFSQTVVANVAAGYTVICNETISLNAGDYIETYVYQNTGINRTAYGGGIANSALSGFLVSPT